MAASFPVIVLLIRIAVSEGLFPKIDSAAMCACIVLYYIVLIMFLR